MDTNSDEHEEIKKPEADANDPNSVDLKPDDDKGDAGNNLDGQNVEVGENADHPQETEATEPDPDIGLHQLLADIDQFISALPHASNEDTQQPLEIPSVMDKFMNKVEAKIDDYDLGQSKFGPVPTDDDSLCLDVVHCLSRLRDALAGFMSESNVMLLLNLISFTLHRAVLLVEDDLRGLLEQSNNSSDRPEPGQVPVTSDQSTEAAAEEEEVFPSYTAEAISSMCLLSKAMISAGYEAECFDAFLIARRHAFEEELKHQGFDKISIDDVQRMQWEQLEGEIPTWIRILKRCSGHLFPGEHKFYGLVLPGHPALTKSLLSETLQSIFIPLVNFAQAVSMTKRSSEKLFKFLDMYEALREVVPTMDDPVYTEKCVEELKFEFATAGSHLGEAAVSIFYELQNSIQSDRVLKTPVPNGAIHPLTPYTMDYLQHACEYKDTLEQLFQQHQKSEAEGDQKEGNSGDDEEGSGKETHFMTRMMTILDLLDKNLEAKSALYKDPSLRYIFMLNNGRYMLKSVRGSPEIHQVVGDPWCRKRSSDMRQYHKSYQRETWSKVLQCLSQEGLQVNGKVQKPVLKERFKNFNQLFDEIHKTQSTWVVSDDQLQSELHVSISAVMIPAYRSFFSRFGQYFTPGRQTEKYIKYQPEDIEGVIEELFEGTTSSMAGKKA